MKKIIVICGSNFNLLGKRDFYIYGSNKYVDMVHFLDKDFKAMLHIMHLQENREGKLLEHIQSTIHWADALIINLGAYTYTSVSLYDAILIFDKPYVEVHLSNIFLRERFRHKSVVPTRAFAQIVGFGHYSYVLALLGLMRTLYKVDKFEDRLFFDW